MTAPSNATKRRRPTLKKPAPLDGALVVEEEEASVARDPALVVSELEPEVGLEPVVLPVLVDEPVLVDIVVLVDAPVVVGSAVVLAAVALVVAAALVMAAELAGEEIDLTVFFDSTTNWAE